MVKIGQKVRFDPFETITGFASGDSKGKLVTGTVVMVNTAHRWFCVEYGDLGLRTSFFFDDIGKAVEVIGK